MSKPSWKDTLIGESEYVDDHRSGMTVVKLNGRLYKCGLISPRLDFGDRVLDCKAAPLTQPRVSSFLPESWGGGSRHVKQGRPWGRQQRSMPGRQLSDGVLDYAQVASSDNSEKTPTVHLSATFVLYGLTGDLPYLTAAPCTSRQVIRSVSATTLKRHHSHRRRSFSCAGHRFAHCAAHKLLDVSSIHDAFHGAYELFDQMLHRHRLPPSDRAIMV
ncbi:unnamed protein product [Triticum turgidum subsp. durum]|uniref:Uncharacterized protein n=1 Tax=Triticum turgidum subsp. durum TaxID=4567 RepID=A0A9R1QWC5_TRITD|nr:unnamed protein product [Triticum turgidum subsp. durum]